MNRLAVTWRLPWFFVWFTAEVFRSSGVVMRDILTPAARATPRVVRLQVRSQSDAALTLLAALITLTPGTLTLGTRTHEGRRVLLVHTMYHPDGETALSSLHDMEDRMLRAFGTDR
ncbi:Na+/H+ antiporter subunit E [Nocardioidaceae bacterium]|nr:Na+/H+ antiporter subunit E [Nocardioidaceae bacterium]